LKKRIAIIGSTGSVGRQTLEVLDWHPDHLEAEVLTAHNNAELLIQQALKYHPNTVVIENDTHYNKVFNALDPHDIKVYAGKEATSQVLEMETIDIAMIAVVGFAGLSPALSALQHGKTVALANKESLVVGGHMLQKAAAESKSLIIPVDSEHSAIFQCLMGEFGNPIKKLVLTASGGPFKNYSVKELEVVTPEMALNHPVWNMGSKISIDSATLMNKGLEAIEAFWLFGVNPEQIEVVIHPESIVHSLVYFEDGNVKTLMGLPDMRLPIQFSLTYPERLKSFTEDIDLLKLGSLNFEAPNVDIFRNLALAFEALEKGGNMPCILNAANEIAVEGFLEGNVNFLQIPKVVDNCMRTVPFIKQPSFDDLMETDLLSRVRAREIIKVD
jgi:1-deoxy-D-xylulose-5-phosphate reductoisomerase